jgi:hypothetical protein
LQAASRQRLSQQRHGTTFFRPENMIGLRQGTQAKAAVLVRKKMGTKK